MAIDDTTRIDRLKLIAKVLGCSPESFIAERETTQSLSDLLSIWPRLAEADRAAVVAFAESCAARWAKAKIA